MEKKRVVISAGGTGGHLFPAQELARELIREGTSEEILFVGKELSKNRYFAREEFDFQEISAATFSLKKPIQTLVGGGRVLRGVAQSCKILKSFSPDVVIGFGSFYTLPLLLGAYCCRYPIVLHEQNAIPGKVNRLISRFARFSAVAFPTAGSLLGGKTIHCTFPTRKKLSSTFSHSLEDDRLTLFVFGGSQGARAINHLFFEAIDTLLDSLPPFQVIHLTGEPCDTRAAKALYQQKQIPAFVSDFEKDIASLYELADLAVSRGGAGSIFERIEYGVPGVVIPYPLASENHQTKNGNFFVSEIKGGSLLEEYQSRGIDLALHILDSVNQLEEQKLNIRKYKEEQKIPTFLQALQVH